jgi:mRNA interferase MazF
VKRGEIWTMAGGPGYATKPRPAVIIQDDGFSETLPDRGVSSDQ